MDMFNGREGATIVWFAVFFVWCLTQKGIRTSIFAIFKTLSSWKLLVIFGVFFAYLSGIIYFLCKVGLWDVSLIKDTVFWVIGSGLVLLFNLNEAEKEKDYFKKIFLESFKLTMIFEFVFVFYSFSFYFEIFLVPILTLILLAVEFPNDHKNLKSFNEGLSIVLGFTAIILFLINVVFDYKNFFSLDTLESLLFPVILTVSYVPLLYIFHLWFMH